MHRVDLPRLQTFDAWRAAARALAASDIPADRIHWQMEGEEASLFGSDPVPQMPPGAGQVSVPREYPALARLLCASRTPGSFDLAYRLLLRVSDTPGLMRNRADPAIAQAEGLAKSIRRDMHKMKAFVRFREVTPPGANRRQFLSWFEPDHRIEELIAGFFVRRFGDMDWVIVTPEVTTRFEGGVLTQQAVATARLDLSDETEALWRTYYANIFNPARLKIKAMQSEMPKKYWKNLPEATLIPGLIARAEAEVRAMQAAGPTLPPQRAERVLERLHDLQHEVPAGSVQALHQAVTACTRCPLAGPATQSVTGEGPVPAALMIVGEQPGDQEDLAGRAFVGPAGQLFDRLAQEAGLDRSAAYVTNAVKHFKFEVRGKRRIHQTPSAQEVSHCRWWLEKEVAMVQPRLILALGATAAQALTGSGKNLMQRRGRVETGLDGLPVYITLHPAAVLRQPGEAARAARTEMMQRDLAEVRQMLAYLEGASPSA